MRGLRRQFAVALVAGMLGALLVSAGPSAIAAIGDSIRIGQVNTGNARTTVQGATNDALVKIENTGVTNDNALSLVSDGPNLRVSNGRKIKKLNADRVDGWSPNQLIRAAHAESLNLADANGVALTVTINAPADGVILMGATVNAEYGSADDVFTCRLDVDLLTVDGSIMSSQVSNAPNVDENCATSGAMSVNAGPHTIDFAIGGRDTATFYGATLWALYVPFDGTGTAVSVP